MPKESVNKWWHQYLEEIRQSGRKDAERGVFDPPNYVTADDPQDVDENEKYKHAFMTRRRELGDKFKWAT